MSDVLAIEHLVERNATYRRVSLVDGFANRRARTGNAKNASAGSDDIVERLFRSAMKYDSAGFCGLVETRNDIALLVRAGITARRNNNGSGDLVLYDDILVFKTACRRMQKRIGERSAESYENGLRLRIAKARIELNGSVYKEPRGQTFCSQDSILTLSP